VISKVRSWVPLVLASQVERSVATLVELHALPNEAVTVVVPNVRIESKPAYHATSAGLRKHEAALVLTNQRLLDVRMNAWTCRATSIAAAWPRSELAVVDYRPGLLSRRPLVIDVRGSSVVLVDFYPGVRPHVEAIVAELAGTRNANPSDGDD
jgi:hypothetical protein